MLQKLRNHISNKQGLRLFLIYLDNRVLSQLRNHISNKQGLRQFQVIKSVEFEITPKLYFQ